MDITGPYPLTPRRNKYILTFIDHFTKYAEAFAISDQSAEIAPEFTPRKLLLDIAQAQSSLQIRSQPSCLNSLTIRAKC